MKGIDPEEHLHEMLDAERERVALLLDYCGELDEIIWIALSHIKECSPNSPILGIIEKKLNDIYRTEAAPRVDGL